MNWNPWLWWLPADKQEQNDTEICRLRKQLYAALERMDKKQEEAETATKEGRHEMRNLRMIIESVGEQLARLKQDGKPKANG
jgi:predicted nucleotide-binding protein (sugar kinase/HSP70/actin superfamily)